MWSDILLTLDPYQKNLRIVREQLAEERKESEALVRPCDDSNNQD